eukprot:CFRG5894T1
MPRGATCCSYLNNVRMHTAYALRITRLSTMFGRLIRPAAGLHRVASSKIVERSFSVATVRSVLRNGARPEFSKQTPGLFVRFSSSKSGTDVPPVVTGERVDDDDKVVTAEDVAQIMRDLGETPVDVSKDKIDLDGMTDSLNAKEVKPEELIEETEVTSGPSEKRDFQAETRKLLDIVAHSLYSDRKVFIREIVSNASDALEKFRYKQLTGEELTEPDLPLEIKISVDQKNNLFIIQDTGIGMTEAELVENLGTIAHSGSKKFLTDIADEAGGESSSKEGIIGQFGVGFYSTFMVGHKVRVYSRSATPGHKGYRWESDGSGSYDISEAEGVQRGTKIIIELKEDSKDFSQLGKVRDIINTMSNFVSYPIRINGDVVNTIKAIWTMPKNEVTDDMHNGFFRFISGDYRDPAYRYQFNTDVPLEIKSLFYIPSDHNEKLGMGQTEPGVSLYCRKVLIQNNVKGILPEWMRFVKGVVDSPDIPLNLSRELLQDSTLIKRMRDLFSDKIVRELARKAKKDPETYDKWYANFGNFIREGIVTEPGDRESIATLVRYETSKTEAGKLSGMKEYLDRAAPDQDKIYYITAPTREVADQSPYMEAFKEKDIEVLYMYEDLDEIVMQHLGTFSKKNLVHVSSSDANLNKDAPETTNENYLNLASWMKEKLGTSVKDVKISTRLTKSPAGIIDPISVGMRRMMQMIDSNRNNALPPQTLEINPHHELLAKLDAVRVDKPELAGRVAHQILENALISAGLSEDPRTMLDRINTLMIDALDNKTTK